jgi:hypothetical protein
MAGAARLGSRHTSVEKWEAKLGSGRQFPVVDDPHAANAKQLRDAV